MGKPLWWTIYLYYQYYYFQLHDDYQVLQLQAGVLFRTFFTGTFKDAVTAET